MSLSKNTVKINVTKNTAVKRWVEWKKNNPNTFLSLKKNGCNDCNSMENLHIHHIDGNKTNQQLENLQCLCMRCHKKAHINLRVLYVDSYGDFVDGVEIILSYPNMQKLQRFMEFTNETDIDKAINKYIAHSEVKI